MTETSTNKTNVTTGTKTTETSEAKATETNKETMTETTETKSKETKNRKKIHFFSEKKWIMAYWYKRSRKAQFTEKYLWELWEKWWGNDFTSKSDERFKELLPWIKEIKNTMKKDEIKQKRRDHADKQKMPQYIKRLAAKKGYCVKKCSTRNHPFKVSGYAVFKNENDKKAVYGNKFNKTAKEVIEYLEAKENK